MTTTGNSWKTKDGRRIAVTKLDDEHLASILRMGLRARHREAMAEAIDALGNASCGDDGSQYFGELHYDEFVDKARSVGYLRGELEKSARFAPLVAEAKRRGLRWTRPKASKVH